MTQDASINDNSHSGMFADCTHLVTAPELPATTIGAYSYESMFYNCTSLVNAPTALPASNIGMYCYSSMFYNCTSLTASPTIASLTESPAFPSNTYDENYRCADNMFEGCINLSTVHCYFTRNYALASSPGPISNKTVYLYTFRWLYNVAETGTFYCKELATATFTSEETQSVMVFNGGYTTKRGYSGIPTNWTISEQSA